MLNEFSWNFILLVFAKIPLFIPVCLKSNISNRDKISSIQPTQRLPFQTTENFICHNCPVFVFLSFSWWLLQRTTFKLQYYCPLAVQYLPRNVHCNTFHSTCTTVHMLCSIFHIMFTVTHYIEPALLSTCCAVPSHTVQCNIIHSTCNTTVHLLCSTFHILFTVTHSIQAATTLFTCCAVPKT